MIQPHSVLNCAVRDIELTAWPDRWFQLMAVCRRYGHVPRLKYTISQTATCILRQQEYIPVKECDFTKFCDIEMQSQGPIMRKLKTASFIRSLSVTIVFLFAEPLAPLNAKIEKARQWKRSGADHRQLRRGVSVSPSVYL